MDLAPEYHILTIPLPKGSPLIEIHPYLIKTDQGSILIDDGWDTDEGFELLINQIKEVGVAPDDLKYIILTHAHPDHIGLTGRLAPLTHADVVIHAVEMPFLESRYIHYDELISKIGLWMEYHGVPQEVSDKMGHASVSLLKFMSTPHPNMLVRGGETLSLGNVNLKIIWTPGHSPGHICLLDEERKVLFSGDHVLPHITPNVGMHVESINNPLIDYMQSLHQISELDVKMVLPAHGAPFDDLKGRIDQILEHHEERMKMMQNLFNGETLTAYHIATRYPWYSSGILWDNLHNFDKRMALAETISHLEVLVARGDLEKTIVDGAIWYKVNYG